MRTPSNIWIVDDDADDREILRDAFHGIDKHLECKFIENADHLLNDLQHADRLPSIILLDLNMPGKDGRDSLKEIKSNPIFVSIPVIVFTTSSSERDKSMSYALGANCFITKPDTFDKLMKTVEHIIQLWLL